jgi:hypothetical protein
MRRRHFAVPLARAFRPFLAAPDAGGFEWIVRGPGVALREQREYGKAADLRKSVPCAIEGIVLLGETLGWARRWRRRGFRETSCAFGFS